MREVRPEVNPCSLSTHLFPSPRIWSRDVDAESSPFFSSAFFFCHVPYDRFHASFTPLSRCPLWGIDDMSGANFFGFLPTFSLVNVALLLALATFSLYVIPPPRHKGLPSAL